MDKLSRREFLGQATTAVAVGAVGAVSLGGSRDALARTIFAPDAQSDLSKTKSAVIKATDRVALGRSGLQISLVGMGTGSIGGGHQSNQTRLGQEAFTRLVLHARDSGINFFDLADSYGTNPYFAKAVKGLPRESYVIQTKSGSRDADGARKDIDRYLRELETDYIDSLIIHCVTEGDWTTRFRGVMDVFAEAKQAGKIRAHGVTCHSFEALQAAAASDWVQLNQVRWNAKASHMDAEVETVRALFAKMRGKGQGMIGMKVVGEGDLVRGDKAMSPEECFRFQIESGVVDAFVVGLEKPEHVDQLIRGTQLALDTLGYRATAA
jgi:predicted aldo/keto reductase-like oxidoreductase